MKYVLLSSNKKAMVDDADFEWLNHWKWSFDGQYAHRMNGDTKIYLHRLIMGNPSKMQIDHRDMNKLNCQRNNLRIGTHSQNNMNKGLQSNSTSGFKGVSWYKAYKKWESKIKIHGLSIKLGYFKTKEEAALAYDIAAIQVHGEFAKFNLGVLDV